MNPTVGENAKIVSASSAWSRKQLQQMLVVSGLGSIVGAVVGLILGLTVFNINKEMQVSDSCTRDGYEAAGDSEMYQDDEWKSKCFNSMCRIKSAGPRYFTISLVGLLTGSCVFLLIGMLVLFTLQFNSMSNEQRASSKISKKGSELLLSKIDAEQYKEYIEKKRPQKSQKAPTNQKPAL